MNNLEFAVKCFQEKEKAEEENNLMERICQLIPNCPGILQYYGMKKLNIE